jgi:diamine N-acetyltransferase
MNAALRLATITPDNVTAACAIKVHPGQEAYVAPVVQSLAEAYASYATAWPRLVYAGDEPVAFVMGGFDPDAEIEFFRCGIWRLNVSARHQGAGYGRFAVEAVLDEARRRGSDRATVMWKPGESGPEGFYRKMGFEPTGQTFAEQAVGAIALDLWFGSPAERFQADLGAADPDRRHAHRPRAPHARMSAYPTSGASTTAGIRTSLLHRTLR